LLFIQFFDAAPPTEVIILRLPKAFLAYFLLKEEECIYEITMLCVRAPHRSHEIQ